MKNTIITLVFLFSRATINAQELPGKVKENILRAVIKIEIPIKKLGKQPNGTGFLVSQPSKLNPKQRQFFLVTNKHVVGDWNLADGNILNYYSKIDLFLYTKGNINSKLFQKKTINILDSSGKTTNKLKLHPNPKVDIAIIDITSEIKIIPDIDLVSFDTSFLLRFDKIYEGSYLGIGDQVFALGYPFGITSSKSNLPIAKSGYISSLPGVEFKIEIDCLNRQKGKVQTTAEGKLIIVDGLIVGGNSGGPVVMPAEIRFKSNEKSGFKYTKGPLNNFVLGIVSMSLGSSGINVIYSSDYILELMETF